MTDQRLNESRGSGDDSSRDHGSAQEGGEANDAVGMVMRSTATNLRVGTDSSMVRDMGDTVYEGI